MALNSNAQWFRVIFYLVIVNHIEFNLCEDVNILKDPRIVIIGAGPSGIAAASKLFEYGFNNITILEAENRIGGRVYTTKFGNYSVDLGGQWVHGQGDNRAYKLAEPLGLLEVSNKSDFAINDLLLSSDSEIWNKIAAKEIRNFFMEFLQDFQFEDNVSYDSFGQYAEKMFDQQFKNKPDMLKHKKKYLHLMELFNLAIDAAETWQDVSARGSLEYTEYPGDQVINWKERTYSTILEILMKSYPNPGEELPVVNNTMLNTEVISINYLQHPEDETPILITAANGKQYKADHVIVTVSLGVLKDRYKSLFIPSLPEEKVSTIEGLGFGSVAKIYLMFDKPFWKLEDERMLHFSLLWNDDDRKAIEADPEKKWLIGMYGVMTVEHKPNLLTLWTVGPYAKDMEALSEKKVFKHAVENLHRFLDKQYNVTEPVAMLRTRWFSNPHFKGAYSYRSVESDKRKVYADMLEKPLIPQNLTILFAGEATSQHRYSTVDGAIDSGWKAADRLIEHHKKLPAKDK